MRRSSLGAYRVRFCRHVLMEKRYPHHGDAAFARCGRALLESLKHFGIACSQPKSPPCPAEYLWG